MPPHLKAISPDLTSDLISVPPNCTFEIDDVEGTWRWSIPFDFIFVPHMNACFESWETMLAHAFK